MCGVFNLSSKDEKAKELFAANKQIAIDKVKRFLMSITAKEKSRVFLSCGEKSFTPEEMLKEIEEETEYGKQLIQMFSRPPDKSTEEEEKR